MELIYLEKSFRIYKYSAIAYWSLSIFFFLLDLFLYKFGDIKKYKYLIKYQKSFDIEIYYNCFKSSLKTFVFVIPGYTVLLSLVASYFNCFEYNYNYIEQILRFIFGIIVQDMIFFYVHRYFHMNKRLYRMIHSEHHKMINNYAIGTLYAHHVENICLNLFSVFISPLIVGIKYPLLEIWFIGAMIIPIFSHCGYKFGGIFKRLNESHDLHHKLFNCNFGVLGLFDYLHGTQK
jgi:sterol desaturase/sphingolipid hydroxylase (fatty acid hydroxylase superfamily)